MTLRRHYNLPPIPTGYGLESNGRSWFSIVVPVATTNLCVNPSFETNTTSWTAIGGSIAQSIVQQYHGAYSLAITPTSATTDGARYDTISMTTGVTYGYSAKVRGVAGLKYKLAIETTGGVELASKTFTANGKWMWLGGYYAETSTTTRRFTVRKAAHASTAVFYLDGVQVEVVASGNTFTTYCDGDQQGLVPNQSPVAFFWTGTPHASTSVRSNQTRAGGMIVPLSKYGFLLTAMIGLGLAAPQNVGADYARIDGGFDNYTRKPSRQFTLTGRFQATTPAQLDRYRTGLSDLLDRDLVGQDQQLTLRYERLGTDDRSASEVAALHAKYESGLGGNADSLYAEQAPLTFVSYMPTIFAEGEQGASLALQTSVSNANCILQRSAAGVWAAMGTGSAVAGTVEAIVVGRDGVVYAGGLFSSMGGVANTPRIAQWSPITQAWTAMGTGGAGVGNRVYALAVSPAGDIIAMGDFTSMGGVGTTASIAKWTVATQTWSSITAGGAANGSVLSGAFDSQGNLYVTGGFTSINGVAANRVAKWDGTTWTALSTGLNSTGNALIIGPGGTNVYVAGTFTTPFTRITKWNGSAFSDLAGGLDGTVRSLAFDAAGNLYAGGDFSNNGSVALSRIGRFNGTQWSPLSTGTSGGTNSVTELTWNGVENRLYVGGVFTSAGGLTLPDAFAIWNGSSFVFPDIDLPASSQVNSIVFGLDGTLYIGFDQNGTATAGSTTTVTNSGSARAYPMIRLTGPTSGSPARVWNIVDTTTNRAIYFNLQLNVGETALLNLAPDNGSFVSNVQGDIRYTIVAGSNTSDFFLQPGANTITMLSASSTITAVMYYHPAYARLDDLTR